MAAMSRHHRNDREEADDNKEANQLSVRNSRTSGLAPDVISRVLNLPMQKFSGRGTGSQSSFSSSTRAGPTPNHRSSQESYVPSSSLSDPSQLDLSPPDSSFPGSGQQDPLPRLRGLPISVTSEPPSTETALPLDRSITLVIMYKQGHFFLTVDLSINLEQLKAKIREKLGSLGPDQNFGEIIPNGLVIRSLVVLWNGAQGLHFPPRTVINDENITPLLLFMKEKKTEYEVVDVQTNEEIREQTRVQTQNVEGGKKRKGQHLG